MTVLADPNGPLDDTVPASRPITLRDLLTYTVGTGTVPAEPGTVPIAAAGRRMGRLGGASARPPARRALHAQTPANVSRSCSSRGPPKVVRGCPARADLRSARDQVHRLQRGRREPRPVSRRRTRCHHAPAGAPVVDEVPPRGGGAAAVSPQPPGSSPPPAATPPPSPRRASAGGAHHGERVLSRPSVTLMTSDQLSPAQKVNPPGSGRDTSTPSAGVSGCRSAPRRGRCPRHVPGTLTPPRT